MIPNTVYLHNQPTMATSFFCIMHCTENEFAFNTEHLEQILRSLCIACTNGITAYKHTIDCLVIGRVDIVLAV